MRSLASIVIGTPLGRQVVRRLGSGRTVDVLADIRPLLSPGACLLDIGAGSCDVAAGLAAEGFRVVPCDIADLSCVPDLHPVLFDGRRLPFEQDSFDAALLITVLHHARDPDALIREARRVARRVVVQEDVFEGLAQKYLTWGMDSVLNLEFLGHPHGNRRDCEWRRAFQAAGLRVVSARSKVYWRAFDSVSYLLERA